MRTYLSRSIRQLRRLLRDMPIGMVATQTAGGVTHSRPMIVQEVDDCGWLWFLTDRSSRKALELIQNPQTTIAFQSAKGDRYVSVQGTAVIVQDDVKVRRMWKPAMRAWFPRGRVDPELVLVAVRVARAEYWLVPRRLSSLARKATSLVAGRRPDDGRHGVLDLYPAPV
jgi:general stress protein 26